MIGDSNTSISLSDSDITELLKIINNVTQQYWVYSKANPWYGMNENYNTALSQINNLLPNNFSFKVSSLSNWGLDFSVDPTTYKLKGTAFVQLQDKSTNQTINKITLINGSIDNVTVTEYEGTTGLVIKNITTNADATYINDIENLAFDMFADLRNDVDWSQYSPSKGFNSFTNKDVEQALTTSLNSHLGSSVHKVSSIEIMNNSSLITLDSNSGLKFGDYFGTNYSSDQWIQLSINFDDVLFSYSNMFNQTLNPDVDIDKPYWFSSHDGSPDAYNHPVLIMCFPVL